MTTTTSLPSAANDDKASISKVEYNDVEIDTEKSPPPRPWKDITDGFDPVYLKKLRRRIDWRLIPVMSAMYAISLIDRTNLAIARAANNVHMDKELGTNSGDKYSIITLIFFIPYIICEIPAQVGLRKFGARIWLGGAVICWGAIMLGMGFVETWYALAALRAVLGVFESVLFPGCAYVISCWYPRRDMALRSSIFYISSAVAGSFAKPLGYCFSLLHEKAGLSGWQWMFAIYGIVTIVIGLGALFLVVDFPDKATFLSDEDRRIVTTIIERDRADSVPDPLTFAKMLTYAKEWQPWLFALNLCASTTAGYSLAYFLPSILTTMGFSNVESMLLGTPAFFWAIIPALVSGRIADRVPGSRALVMIFNQLCVIIGTLMYSQLPKAQRAARFAGIFFAVGGAHAGVPLAVAWQQTNIRSQSKRAFGSALTIAWGGIGGIFGSALFMQKEQKAGYPTGVWFTVGINALVMVECAALSMWMRRQNRRAERGETVVEGHEDFRYQP